MSVVMNVTEHELRTVQLTRHVLLVTGVVSLLRYNKHF